VSQSWLTGLTTFEASLEQLRHQHFLRALKVGGGGAHLLL
jgi:hypothetical protein